MRAYEIIDEGKFGDALKTGIAVGGIALAGTNAYSGSVPAAPTQPPAEYAIDLPDPIPHEPAAEIEAEPDPREEEVSRFRQQATLLALTMWGEARGHGKEGMRAVGHVVVNRLNSSRKFGDSIQDVVWKRKAFSCWNPSDPNRQAMREIEKLPEGSPDYRRWQEAKKLATKILRGESSDPTNGAIFYHAERVSPTWARGISPVAKFADHIFYREDRKAES
jgi:spore germination cell wall hydrolase CwlJ-like protein